MNCKDEKFMSDFSVRFDEEIKSFAENNLNSCHVFELGFPGEILVNAGFPKEKEIQFKGSILTSKENKHAFSVLKLKGLVNKLSEPVAVFSYLGDRGRNVIIDTKKRGKNYLVGINKAFNLSYQGLKEYKEEKHFKQVLNQISLVDVKEAVRRADIIMRENKKRGYKPNNYLNYSWYSENPSTEVGNVIGNILSNCGL